MKTKRLNKEIKDTIINLLNGILKEKPRGLIQVFGEKCYFAANSLPALRFGRPAGGRSVRELSGACGACLHGLFLARNPEECRQVLALEMDDPRG